MLAEVQRHAIPFDFDVGGCVVGEVMLPLDFKAKESAVKVFRFAHIDNAKDRDRLFEYDGHEYMLYFSAFSLFESLRECTLLMGVAKIRLGLCCMFRDEPIKFVTTTATVINKMKRPDTLAKLSRLCLENADALLAALQFCADNDIGCFRVNSQILPIKTHPTCGYEVDDLPEDDEIIRRFKECGKFAKKYKLRTCFHPDQFVVLNSPRLDVVEKSIQELEYQAEGEVAEWIGADVINIHGGGAYVPMN